MNAPVFHPLQDEQKERVSEMEGKNPPAINQDIKQGIKDHPLSPK